MRDTWAISLHPRQLYRINEEITMITTYKVFSPRNGSYTTHLTLDDCLQRVLKNAYEFYLEHTHGQPYSIVTKIDDVEVWKTPEGVEIPSPEKIAEEIEKYSKNIAS